MEQGGSGPAMEELVGRLHHFKVKKKTNKNCDPSQLIFED